MCLYERVFWDVDVCILVKVRDLIGVDAYGGVCVNSKRVCRREVELLLQEEDPEEEERRTQEKSVFKVV